MMVDMIFLLFIFTCGSQRVGVCPFAARRQVQADERRSATSANLACGIGVGGSGEPRPASGRRNGTVDCCRSLDRDDRTNEGPRGEERRRMSAVGCGAVRASDTSGAQERTAPGTGVGPAGGAWTDLFSTERNCLAAVDWETGVVE